MGIMVSVSQQAEATLKQRAAASGKDLMRYASDILEEAAADSRGDSRLPEQPTADQRLEQFQRFVNLMETYSKRLPAGHVVNDSRESIYAGRGE